MMKRNLTIVVDMGKTMPTTHHPTISIIATNLNTHEQWLYDRNHCSFKPGFYHMKFLVDDSPEKEINFAVKNNSAYPLYIIIRWHQKRRTLAVRLFEEESQFVSYAVHRTLQFPDGYFED